MKKTLVLMLLLVVGAFVAGATTELPWSCTDTASRAITIPPNGDDQARTHFQPEPASPDKPSKPSLLGAVLRGSSLHTP